MSNLLSSFPERLRQLRTAKALTQSELADALGVSRNSIFFYETGKRTPDILVLKKISDYFGVTCDYMIGASINRSEETREIGDALGLTDEAIETLKNVTMQFEAKKDTARNMECWSYLHGINSIISNKKLVTAIGNYLFGITPDIPDGSFVFFFDADGEHVYYKTDTREQEKLANAWNMSRIKNELEQMRGEVPPNANKEN